MDCDVRGASPSFGAGAGAVDVGFRELATGVDIRFVRPVRTGVLVADAREEAVSRRLSTCTVRVADESGDLVDLSTGTAFQKDEPLSRP